jgi:hypothetical protein
VTYKYCINGGPTVAGFETREAAKDAALLEIKYAHAPVGEVLTWTVRDGELCDPVAYAYDAYAGNRVSFTQEAVDEVLAVVLGKDPKR